MITLIEFNLDNQVHFDFLYYWRNSPEYKMFISNRNLTRTENDRTIIDNVRNNIWLNLSLVFTKDTCIGFVFGYKKNARIFVTIFIDEKHRKFGYGRKAGILLSAKILNTDIDAVYFEIQQNNTPSLKVASSCDLEFISDEDSRVVKNEKINVVIFKVDIENISKLLSNFA